MNRPDSEVLIVEDNNQTARSLALMIGHFNVQCEIASNGYQATKLLKDDQYLHVSADTHMPKISGCDLLKYIKFDHPSIQDAVISTSNTVRTQGLVIKSRADFYQPKLFRMTDVEGLLAAALELRDHQRH